MNGSGTQVCKLDPGGNVLYQGDWCAGTNSAATSTCSNGVKINASFAASSVKILN